MILFKGGWYHIVNAMRAQLLQAPEVNVGEWHSQTIAGIPQLVTQELQDASFVLPIPQSTTELQGIVKPNLPWAENHFMERVGGKPLNPPPSAPEWPYAQAGHQQHTDDEGIFSHTYPERMWPKHAGAEEDANGYSRSSLCGIRFEYGDLEDVVEQLHKSPMTRQAYLPIWFPEDTGAVHGERVPCSLGYHFMIRDNQINVTYMIRSCDFVRHFADDVYMAARLCQWVWAQLVVREGPDDLPVPYGLHVGNLTMHMMSLHIFKGDVPKLEKEVA